MEVLYLPKSFTFGLLGLSHTDAFFMRRVAFNHNALVYYLYFRRCLILDFEKKTALLVTRFSFFQDT